ncbi:MAG TPA: type IX secretion system outer membrane channel protein PorV [Bacteroidales bacterium]|nr:type IX secretion system outer membrane channel protein PorV [Bacteroidales bacterium]HPS74018.1 type IX secretion system outer membrane channel protein PorV [Bacteroidales bacterium]
MRNSKFFFALILGCVLLINTASGQKNVITTAVPFLTITPDAHAGSMGGVGAATTPDAYSIYWNPAKYAFIEKDFGVGISYVPWLKSMVNDIGLASFAIFKRLGDKQAIAGSLRYFSLGEVQYTDENGYDLAKVKPNEWTIDATYSRKFSRSFSGAVAGRFIYSDLVQLDNQNNGMQPGTSVAADISVYYHHELEIKGLQSAWISAGLDISNIGSKISYNKNSTYNDFIPTNLRIGPTFTMDLDDYNRLSFSFDLNKLLVPSSPVSTVSPIRGILESFSDAPGGFSEEVKEISVSVGAEYWYNKLFALRGGYFYENKDKGDRQFFTMGAGIRYNVFGLDFSYLVPVTSLSPLQNTLQFTLLFNFEPVKKGKSGSN